MENDRNKHTSYIQWHFIADNARSKFVSLYSKVRLLDQSPKYCQ